MKAIKQRDLSDCGVACLAAIATHYGARLSVAHLRQISGTDQNGTTVFGLVQASKLLGFIAKAVKAKPVHLSEIALPAIAHVTVREQGFHYIVILKIKKNRETAMDPVTGRFLSQTLAEFGRRWTGVLILLAPGTTFQRHEQRYSRASRYLQLLKPHWPALIQALFGAILATLLALSGSFYIQKVVDSVIVESNLTLLNLLSVTMVVILAFQVLLTTGQNILLTKAALNIDLTLILSYYRHLYTLPQPFFDGMRVGEMISRMNDAIKIRTFLSQQGTALIISALTLILTVLVMFVFSWTLGFIALAFLALYSMLFTFAVRRNRRVSRRMMEESADFDAQIVESLEIASTLRRSNRQWVAEIKTEALFVRLLHSAYSSGRCNIAVRAVATVIVQGFSLTLLWMGASAVIRTEMSPGQLLSCFALTGYLTGPAYNLLSILESVLEVQLAADRLFEILDLEGEKQAGTLELKDVKPLEIRLDKVSFAYPGRLPILKEVDAIFRQGELTLLRGESGCGKSSVLALLQGLYPPTGGRILFGPYEIQNLRVASLRTQIVTVSQKIDLLSGSVLENITSVNLNPMCRRSLHCARSLASLNSSAPCPQV
jgi:ATP-binding cassette, subfamily C, bacteriocin exporter